MPKPISSSIKTGPGQGAGRPGPPGPPGAGFTAGLDLTGTSREQTVIGFRAVPLSETAPNDGESYVYSSSLGQFVPAASGGGGGRPGVIRASWASMASLMTFASGPGPTYDVVTEAGGLTGLNQGETVLIIPSQALVGAFHSGSPAPQYGGVWDVLDLPDDQNMTVQRNSAMSTAEKIASIGIVCVDRGGAMGIFQVQTPPAAVLDVDPQIIYMSSIPVHVADGNTYALQATGEALSWVLVP